MLYWIFVDLFMFIKLLYLLGGKVSTDGFDVGVIFGEDFEKGLFGGLLGFSSETGGWWSLEIEIHVFLGVFAVLDFLFDGVIDGGFDF